MEYLRLKHSRSDTKFRKNGTKAVIPLFIEKSRKYGNVRREKAISRKRPILVTGTHNSGKSHFLGRMSNHALDIWGGHPRVRGMLWFETVRPLSAWQEQTLVIEWYETEYPNRKKTWKQLKSWEKDDLLPRYCEATRAVVFIDDAHKLNGRKADLALKCLLSAKTWVVSTTEENQLPPTLRTKILRANPQIFSLNSDTPEDKTYLLIWGLIVGSVLMGFYEMGIVLAGMRFFGRGRRASRQD